MKVRFPGGTLNSSFILFIMRLIHRDVMFTLIPQHRPSGSSWPQCHSKRTHRRRKIYQRCFTGRKEEERDDKTSLKSVTLFIFPSLLIIVDYSFSNRLHSSWSDLLMFGSPHLMFGAPCDQTSSCSDHLVFEPPRVRTFWCSDPLVLEHLVFSPPRAQTSLCSDLLMFWPPCAQTSSWSDFLVFGPPRVQTLCSGISCSDLLVFGPPPAQTSWLMCGLVYDQTELQTFPSASAGFCLLLIS